MPNLYRSIHHCDYTQSSTHEMFGTFTSLHWYTFRITFDLLINFTHFIVISLHLLKILCKFACLKLMICLSMGGIIFTKKILLLLLIVLTILIFRLCLSLFTRWKIHLERIPQSTLRLTVTLTRKFCEWMYSNLKTWIQCRSEIKSFVH